MASEPAADLDEPTIAAGRVLVARGAIGGIWLTPNKTILHIIGKAPFRAEPGMSITDACAVLIGLEDEIEALRYEQPNTRVLRIPNAAVIGPGGAQSQRVNISVSWVEEREQYLVLLAPVMRERSPTEELDQEIRRRRLLEQDLAFKTEETRRINQQLEEFAYVISHDLNAPLRALRYLSGDVSRVLDERDASDAASQDAALRNAANGIVTQTRRMSRMLIDLLEYARIGRVEEQVADVDTRAIVEDIRATLAPSTSLEIEILGDWPRLTTAGVPLDVVLRNLAENAVKHHDRTVGRVTMRAALQERAIEFRVEDDGRGIAAEWHEAIFMPFKKIDDAHHPESSGIGLALVKKTVTSLGGSIQVLSEAPERRGTTFIVRWPLRLSASDKAAS